jgi:hypothetical protein
MNKQVKYTIKKITYENGRYEYIPEEVGKQTFLEYLLGVNNCYGIDKDGFLESKYYDDCECVCTTEKEAIRRIEKRKERLKNATVKKIIYYEIPQDVRKKLNK